MTKNGSDGLVYSNCRVFKKPDSDWCRITLFLEDEEGMPYEVWSPHFKTRVLPSMIVKEDRLEGVLQALDKLHGSYVEIYYNEYGQIKDVRPC